MLAPWLLYASALGALLGIMALLMERIARWRAKPARWIWLAAIVAIVMIPTGLSFRPGSPGITRTPHASGAVRFDQSPELPRAIDAPLLILWLLASTLLASRIVGTAISLRRRRNRWLPATLGGHSILVADQLGPAVIGWRRLTTVIPRWALSLDEGSRALILQHEAEHARSGDPYLRSAALVALVLMPWNPAIWWAMRRLRLAVEIDCDQRVLGRGVDAHHYATLLLAVGERMSRIPFAWATALGGSRSFLERRILAMTATLQPRHRRGAIISVSAGIGLIVALACEAPVPDPIAPPTASKADTVNAELLTVPDVGPPSASRADTVNAEFLLAKVERDSGFAFRSLDCNTNVRCGADSVVRLGYLIKSDRGEVGDSVVDQIITVTGRRSGRVVSLRVRPGGTLREVQGFRIIPDSTPR
ncbi:MAG TPA: M56 family metallopeptidase [Gemmatimonadales bacterium]|nr:M56 family metallopeptidase [Gemmatimonadales bacterium]